MVKGDLNQRRISSQNKILRVKFGFKSIQIKLINCAQFASYRFTKNIGVANVRLFTVYLAFLTSNKTINKSMIIQCHINHCKFALAIGNLLPGSTICATYEAKHTDAAA